MQLVALFRNTLLTFAFGTYIIGAGNKNVNCHIFLQWRQYGKHKKRRLLEKAERQRAKRLGKNYHRYSQVWKVVSSQHAFLQLSERKGNKGRPYYQNFA